MTDEPQAHVVTAAGRTISSGDHHTTLSGVAPATHQI